MTKFLVADALYCGVFHFVNLAMVSFSRGVHEVDLTKAADAESDLTYQNYPAYFHQDPFQDPFNFPFTAPSFAYMLPPPLPPFPSLYPPLPAMCLPCAFKNTPCLVDGSAICLSCQKSNTTCDWDPQIRNKSDAQYCLTYSLRCLIASHIFYRNFFFHEDTDLLRLFENATSILRRLSAVVDQTATPRPTFVVPQPERQVSPLSPIVYPETFNSGINDQTHLPFHAEASSGGIQRPVSMPHLGREVPFPPNHKKEVLAEVHSSSGGSRHGCRKERL
ncbi:hypothetical protein K435DRAFT_880395 [Dendrothele bispora CBS 962.96]|uniref:Uncharacterized protein n=1 Tax=Dendrothele bispora (strain CBS 962.96) TaxID=1314807 RepID=A0A4S8KKJ2_DENBC|nr:hypothetical protein K435DRAFT_880395 [Dendrothele bispora CBS 962.96]